MREHPTPQPSETDPFAALERRLGRAHLQKRLRRQVKLATRFYAAGGYASIHLEHLEWIPVVVKLALKAAGIYQLGRANATDYRVETHRVVLERLPAAGDGLRIIQLSDLHADAIPDGGTRLAALLPTLRAEMLVLTGDFRFLTQDRHREALEKTVALARKVDAPLGVWAVLGNHDFIEFVPFLESHGIRVLLNEAVPITHRGATLWLAGIDDAHLYDCHDIGKALAPVPPGACTVMLSHTPEVYREAAAAGVDYLICGHTHGGQICLPGGIPAITNARCPRRLVRGPWRHDGMPGYTSRATGASGLAVRFNCPPEITVHELRAARNGVDPGAG